ncbi:MAG: hypothetical protein IPK17_03810 [Chloroflexi bacterium]|uniref:hypothetical protein n=1 Tax=Candidatus Flexifilum breve TaxID=3140694 RepID=UPI0031354770|nr:hypothetical protein [Chloroflexota bacterium]
MQIEDVDVIAPQYIEVYQKECQAIYWRLWAIHNELFILEKIESFPFDLFTAVPRRTFWKLIKRALIESIIVNLWTLVAEQDGLFALQVFQNRIMTKFKRPDIDVSVDEYLKKQLRRVDFKSRSKQVAMKINEIRNRYIAHMDYPTHIDPSSVVELKGLALNIAEIKEVHQTAYELFQVLWFGNYPVLDEWEYAPRPNAPNFITDVEILLSFVASRSSLFAQSDFAVDDKLRDERLNELTEEQIQMFNEWAEKIRLARIPTAR